MRAVLSGPSGEQVSKGRRSKAAYGSSPYRSGGQFVWSVGLMRATLIPYDSRVLFRYSTVSGCSCRSLDRIQAKSTWKSRRNAVQEYTSE